MSTLSASFSDPVTAAVVVAGLLLGAALLFALVRAWRGPTAADRVVALDLLGGTALAIAVLTAIKFAQPVYLDVVLILAIFGFVGTVALARWIDAKGGRS